MGEREEGGQIGRHTQAKRETVEKQEKKEGGGGRGGGGHGGEEVVRH